VVPPAIAFAMSLPRVTVGLLAAAWATIALGGFVLAVGYERIPAEVVLYRPPGTEAPLTAPKSLLTVGRIAFMGAGQLGAATALVAAARESSGWRRFWLGLGVVAATKTLLECIGFVATPESATERALTIATFAVVGLFIVSALGAWRRRKLGPHPLLAGTPRFALLVSVAFWAAFALGPLAPLR